MFGKFNAKLNEFLYKKIERYPTYILVKANDKNRPIEIVPASF